MEVFCRKTVTTGRTDGMEKYGHRFNRSFCVKEVAVGILTQYPRLHHCTGACSVGASVQPVLKRFADQLKQAFWNKVLPMHRCFDSEPSVQPVLKSSWSPSKHALWNKGLSLHRCFDFGASVQPVLKRVEVHQNMLSGTKDFHCTGALISERRFNRC